MKAEQDDSGTFAKVTAKQIEDEYGNTFAERA